MWINLQVFSKISDDSFSIHEVHPVWSAKTVRLLKHEVTSMTYLSLAELRHSTCCLLLQVDLVPYSLMCSVYLMGDEGFEDGDGSSWVWGVFHEHSVYTARRRSLRVQSRSSLASCPGCSSQNFLTTIHSWLRNRLLLCWGELRKTGVTLYQIRWLSGRLCGI